MSDPRSLPEPNRALFPDRESRLRLDDALTRALAAAGERVAKGSVVPDLDRDEFAAELVKFDFTQPRPPDALLNWAVDKLEHGVVHMNHPRYFGLFNPAANFPSQCADRIAGAFNPQLASSASSPVPVAIEAHVIRAWAERAGLPADSGGHFTTSGSEANYTALLCALTRADARFGDLGARAFAGPLAVYTSRECQPAWFKIVHQAGIGRDSLRLLATDGRGRIDVRALADLVRRDRANGIVPVLISPTAGTTGAGMIDPLAECAALARSEGIWCHVDAAWGGAALASTRLRGLLAGIEQADSLTIDAHKWLATTMGCGMFITRHASVLSDTFRVSADFMPSSVTRFDPYLNSVQWSRRFLGLRLFLSMGAAGWSGYAAHVERATEVTDRVKAGLVARGWTVANDSGLAVLCVLPPAGFPPVRDMARSVVESGRAWVAVASHEGRDVLRICVTHGEAALADVDALIAALEATA